MRKLLIPFLLLFVVTGLAAQAPFPTAAEAAAFARSKTLVVLEDDMFSLYNTCIHEAMEKNWTLTPCEYISGEEFKSRRKDPAFTFLVLTQNRYERDKSGATYTFLNILMGKDVPTLENMPEFGSFPLSYSGVDAEKFVFRLELIIRFFQDHVKRIIQDPTVTGLKFLKYYNVNVPRLTGKKILFTAEDLSPLVNTVEKIRALYSYNFEIVSQEEIQQAIDTRADNTVILHKVGPETTQQAGWSYKVLMGCDDACIYYFNYHIIDAKNPDGFLPLDFKRLARY